MSLRFAVAGVPLSTPSPGGTVEGLKHAAKLGITAMELEWVQRVPPNEDRMILINTTAKELGMTLTVHAPYYINLNSPEPATLAASKKRILDALRMSEIAGVRSVCVHPAFNLGQPPETVYDKVRRAVDDIMSHKFKEFPSVNLGLETMGKPTQFGTLEEVLRISQEFDIYPVVDPAHMHARTNGLINTTREWDEMLDMYEKYLGKASLKNVHMHFSGIAYGPKGEKHHLPLQESDARWEDFLKVLKKRKVEGVCVCESPLMEKDTLLMQKTFYS
ncbi:MAG: TIM barrel protein [Candidatus Peribacteraceae bacterium]|nr:TIM barrel protein [Candidatus Peribacteraceae bacterium]